MFGYDINVIINMLTLFFVTAIAVFGVLMLLTRARESDSIIVISMIAVIAGLVVSLSLPQAIEKREAKESLVLEQVAEVLNVPKEEVSKSSTVKVDYDYTFKVEDSLVGVDYDFTNNEVESIISNDKYLYERGQQ